MIKNKKSLKFFFPAVALLLTAASAFAQGNGAAGITEATQMVTSYFGPATQLIYAIGAVVGLIGGVKVYSKFV
jgi:type IV secretory pathway VirB2 component (pilin)